MGAAATSGNRTELASLQKFKFIFTAENHAIHLALNTISVAKRKKFSTFTDSRSCLQALQKPIQTSPKVRKLKQTIANLQKLGKTVKVCWIPEPQVFQETKSQIKMLKKHQDGKKK